MSVESDAASQVSGIYTEALKMGGEILIKLGETVISVGLPSIAQTLAKAWRQEDKQGKLRIENLTRRASETGKPLQIFGSNIETTEQLTAVEKDLKLYGVSYSAADNVFIVCEDQAPILNHILQKHGLNLVENDLSEQPEEIFEEAPKPEQKATDTKLQDDEKESTNADDFLDSIFAEEEKTSQIELNDDEKEFTNADDFLDSIFAEKEKTSQVGLNDDEKEHTDSDVFLDDILTANQKENEQSLNADKTEPIVSEDLHDDIYSGRSEEMTERLESNVVETVTIAAAINIAAEGKKVPQKGTDRTERSVPKSQNAESIRPSVKEKSKHLKATKAAKSESAPKKGVAISKGSAEMTRG